MMLALVLSVACLSFLVQRRAPGVENRGVDPGDRRIRCPRCGWEPRKHDRWYCDPGCQNRWNTFDTAGICPQCSKHWEQTACLSCHQWSPHADWYEPGR
jgi:hypothetical protein